jgi:hypothetical protein
MSVRKILFPTAVVIAGLGFMAFVLNSRFLRVTDFPTNIGTFTLCIDFDRSPSCTGRRTLAAHYNGHNAYSAVISPTGKRALEVRSDQLGGNGELDGISVMGDHVFALSEHVLHEYDRQKDEFVEVYRDANVSIQGPVSSWPFVALETSYLSGFFVGVLLPTPEGEWQMIPYAGPSKNGVMSVEVKDGIVKLTHYPRNGSNDYLYTWFNLVTHKFVVS